MLGFMIWFDKSYIQRKLVAVECYILCEDNVSFARSLKLLGKVNKRNNLLFQTLQGNIKVDNDIVKLNGSDFGTKPFFRSGSKKG